MQQTARVRLCYWGAGNPTAGLVKADTRDYPRAAPRAMSAECAVCPKADTAGRFMSTRPSPRRRLPLGHALDCITQLGGTLTLLGELEPIARQLFVAPFAFFLPVTIGKLWVK
jgi:hypothetical protein